MKVDIVILFFTENRKYVARFFGIDPHKKKNTELMLFALHPLANEHIHKLTDCLDDFVCIFDLHDINNIEIWDLWNQFHIWDNYQCKTTETVFE